MFSCLANIFLVRQSYTFATCKTLRIRNAATDGQYETEEKFWHNIYRVEYVHFYLLGTLQNVTMSHILGIHNINH